MPKPAPAEERVIRIAAGPVALEGNLRLPENALGVVLFAHGSGSGRHSPRNRFVAAQLGKARLGTLLIDLLTREEQAVVAARENAELKRREQLYRDDRPPPDVRGRVVILIDDGLATGSSMRAAVAALRRLDPARIVVAVPVGAPETCALLRDVADEALCALTPEPFYAVGLWYADFAQVTDDEVRDLLARAEQECATVKHGA